MIKLTDKMVQDFFNKYGVKSRGGETAETVEPQAAIIVRMDNEIEPLQEKIARLEAAISGRRYDLNA